MTDVELLQQVLSSCEAQVSGAKSEVLEQLEHVIKFTKFPMYPMRDDMYDAFAPGYKPLIVHEVYNKAVDMYNIKEYLKSYTCIIDAIRELKPLDGLTIKLLIANIQCLGHHDIARLMYAKYYEVTNDVECLFYAGLCEYLGKNRLEAKRDLSKFLTQVDGSVQNRTKYAPLIKQAANFIDLLTKENTQGE